MIRLNVLAAACLSIMLASPALAQQITAARHLNGTEQSNSELRYVVYLSRHGVRSPTGQASQYNRFSAAPWPEWAVQPGYLTPHGFHLMEQFGAYDRSLLADEGLLQPSGCADASRVTVYADSDQRTRETGKAIAQGLMPGCSLGVQFLPEGTHDPLFHPDPRSNPGSSAQSDAALAVSAIAGRVGSDPANLTLAYHSQLAALDSVLATCGSAPSSAAQSQRTSLFEVPASLAEGNGDHRAELKGPLSTASTLSENLLLEYAEGLDTASVGWGCVHRAEVNAFMALHTASVDFGQRTPEIARAQALNLLTHIRLSIEQAASQKRLRGAIGRPSDRVLFLIGHDTNQENVAGLLNLTWIIDGRRDDTPPGGALMFELWRNRSDGKYSVRAYFTAQTLEQMRASTALTALNPPERVPVFIPGCSRADMSCSLDSFLRLLD